MKTKKKAFHLDKIDIAIIGVPENRNDINYIGEEINLSEIRKSFYSLYPGNWSIKIGDYGDLTPSKFYKAISFAIYNFFIKI